MNEEFEAYEELVKEFNNDGLNFHKKLRRSRVICITCMCLDIGYHVKNITNMGHCVGICLYCLTNYASKLENGALDFEFEFHEKFYTLFNREYEVMERI